MTPKYYNGKEWLEIEDGMILTNHFGKSKFLHLIAECTDECPKADSEEYCPCCERYL